MRILWYVVMGNINQRVGARIKIARLERKLSREQVARRLGVRQQTIEKYEKGSVEISVKRLSQLSNVLNVGISYLLIDGVDDLAFQYFVRKQTEINKS